MLRWMRTNVEPMSSALLQCSGMVEMPFKECDVINSLEEYNHTFLTGKMSDFPQYNDSNIAFGSQDTDRKYRF